LGAIQAAAASLGVELSPVGMRDAGEIERGISTFARSANGGLIVAASTLAFVHRERIITLAARYKLPAVYFVRGFVAGGGLIAYGPNQIDPCRRAAGYVDRILKGEKPADLPVQAPTKYDLRLQARRLRGNGPSSARSYRVRQLRTKDCGFANHFWMGCANSETSRDVTSI
jgi:putative ABC transport system substrate-binding protein